MTILLPIIAYLVGSIPFGYIIVRVAKGLDIREHGSKNVGATNVWRVAGRPFGIAAFILDMLKGLLPVAIVCNMTGGIFQGSESGLLISKSSLAMICGIAAILGHIFPIYLRFKGGKAAATGCGVFLVLAPKALIIAVIVWVLTIFISKFVSMGTILASIALAVAVIIISADPFGNEICLSIFSVIMSVTIIILHRSNIGRIINGTENKIKA